MESREALVEIIPKPIYQTREEANPVLIASPKGVFV